MPVAALVDKVAGHVEPLWGCCSTSALSSCWPTQLARCPSQTQLRFRCWSTWPQGLLTQPTSSHFITLCFFTNAVTTHLHLPVLCLLPFWCGDLCAAHRLPPAKGAASLRFGAAAGSGAPAAAATKIEKEEPKSAPPCEGRNLGQNLRRRVLAKICAAVCWPKFRRKGQKVMR